jgi:DNA-binding MarR family transcriptional regulator
LDRQIESVMDATRVLVAVVAQSLAQVEPAVSLPQLRVLVMVNQEGPLNLGGVARGLGVHPSNATRTCQRLIEAGLLDRQDDESDRRHAVLSLTEAGTALVESVMQHRRDSIERMLKQLGPTQRAQLSSALAEFAQAVGGSFEEQSAALVWP